MSVHKVYAFFVQYVYIAPACCDLRYFGSPKLWSAVIQTSAADPHHYDAHPNTDSHPACDSDADPTFHFDSDPDPNPVPSFQSAQIGFHSFWLVIGKFMRIRMQLIALMRMRIRILPFNLNVDPCGSGSTTLIPTFLLAMICIVYSVPSCCNLLCFQHPCLMCTYLCLWIFSFLCPWSIINKAKNYSGLPAVGFSINFMSTYPSTCSWRVYFSHHHAS